MFEIKNSKKENFEKQALKEMDAWPFGAPATEEVKILWPFKEQEIPALNSEKK